MKTSAGILLFRRRPELEVMLVHAGGPFWVKKDEWEIPKGSYEEGEDPRKAAKREFNEELGKPTPAGREIKLGERVNSVWAERCLVDDRRWSAGARQCAPIVRSAVSERSDQPDASDPDLHRARGHLTFRWCQSRGGRRARAYAL